MGCKNQPHWKMEVPQTVTLACSHCGAHCLCDVRRVECLSNTHTRLSYYSAEIYRRRCDDCGKMLCPHCPRVPHPDDVSLIRCAECRKEEAEHAR
jgi:hypothetical protein